MKKFICLMLVVALTFSFSACGSYEPIEPTTYAPATEIKPVTILYDFFKNELVAKETHIEKRYRITATAVTQITEEYVYIEQELDTGSFYIKLFYEKSQMDYVKTLGNGDTVTFEGTLTDVFPPNGMIQCGLTFEEVVFVEKSE